MLVTAAVINRFLKISLHACLPFSAQSFFSRSIPSGSVALVLALLVAWSRLYLRRHALPEVMAGIGLGCGWCSCDSVVAMKPIYL